MNNRLRVLSALLCLVFLLTALSGCMQVTFEDSASGAPAVLPRPTRAAANAPVGDSFARYRLRTTIYYYNAEGSLTSTLRLIDVGQGQDRFVRIVEALLEAPYLSSSLSPIAPEGTRLIGVESSGGVVTVDLGAELLAAGEEAVWKARAAIARTFLEQGGVTAVNMLIEGQAVEAAGLPLGALTKQDGAVSAGYDQLLAERRRSEESSDENARLDRVAVVYVPEDGLLLPEAAELHALAADLPEALLSAFLTANGLPDAGSFSLEITPAGRRVARVRFPGDFPMDPSIAAALVFTMARFLPAVGGVAIDLGGEPLPAVGPVPCGEDQAFAPGDLTQLLGSEARLYFPRADGTLAETRRALPGFVLTGRALLAQLLEGPDATQELEPVFPEGARESDLLGVRVEEGIAHVNLSASLYGACQSFDAARERAFAYAIINTLVANLDSVTQVQFYISGDFADTLAGRISILAPLMADPGLVR